MTAFPMTIPDVLASSDVLVDVQDASDSMTAEQCIEYRVACEKVLRAAKDAITMLNTQFVKIAETDVIRDGMRYYVGRKKDQVRFSHDVIAGKVIDTAVARTRDEKNFSTSDPSLVFVRDGARQAVDLMTKLYVADSTDAKIGALNAIGLNTDRGNPRSVRTWTPGDKVVTVVPAGGET